MSSTPGGPKISVLLPVWNDERFIHLSIQTILRQSYRNFELVIVDDGSTDRTKEVVKKYQAGDQRIRLVDKPHSGLIATLNVGLEECKTELIARQDSGDLSHYRRLELLTQILLTHTDVSCVSARSLIVDGKYRPRALYPLRKIQNINDSIDRNETLITHPASMFRKADVLRAGGYPGNLHCEDVALWKNMRTLEMNFHWLDVPLYAMVRSGKGVSGENLELQLVNVLKLFGQNVADEELRKMLKQKMMRERVVYGISYAQSSLLSPYLPYALVQKFLHKMLIFSYRSYVADLSLSQLNGSKYSVL